MAELHIDIGGTRTILHQRDDQQLEELVGRMHGLFSRDGGAWCAVTQSGRRTLMWVPRGAVLIAQFDADDLSLQLKRLAVNIDA